jgi:hypothetical protein
LPVGVTMVACEFALNSKMIKTTNCNNSFHIHKSKFIIDEQGEGFHGKEESKDINDKNKSLLAQ